MRNKNWIEFDNSHNLNVKEQEDNKLINFSRIRIFTQKKGKKGKTITIIDGLNFQNGVLDKKLLKDL